MRFKTAQPLPKELLRALLACDNLRQLEPVAVETIRSVERHVSAIYQVRIKFRQHNSLYWVKVNPRKNGVAEQEYNFLCNAYDRFVDVPDLAVLHPVAYLKKYDTLVTEHSAGEALSAYVKRRSNYISSLVKNNDDIKHNFYMCGKMLSILHEQQLPESQCYTWEQLFEYIDIRLKWLLKDWGLDTAFYKRMLAYFESKKSELSDVRLVRVKTHGDYAPYNVLVSNNDLVMFDPSVGQYYGSLDNYCSQYEDIVHFYKWSQNMFSPFVSRRTRSELVSRFIDGYNDNSELNVETTSPAFEVFMVKYKLLSVFDVWPSVISKLSSRKTRVKSFKKWFDNNTIGAL